MTRGHKYHEAPTPLRLMFYMYVLFSLKDHALYFGWTVDLRARFKEHQAGKVQSTRPRRPWKLVYYEAYASREDAMERERQLKHYAKAWGQLKRRIQRSIRQAA